MPHRKPFDRATQPAFRGVGMGFVLIVIAQLGLLVSIGLALAIYGREFSALAVIVAFSLLCVNAGLAHHYLYLRRTAEASRRLRLLAEMNVEVNREILLNEDIEHIYRTILDYLFQLFDKVSTGSILIVGDDGNLRFAAWRGFTDDYAQNFCLKLEESFLYQDTGGRPTETRLIEKATIERMLTRFDPGDWQYKSVISAPIFVGDRIYGLLNLDSDHAGTFNADDAHIVERFRNQIEVGLLARERYRTSIERSQVDALTELFTRRYFEDVFSSTLERARRYKETFVLALFDTDGLKHVNDHFGHLAGDQLLLTIATALRTSCRKSDIIGRFGGDEFIAVYYRTDSGQIEENIEKVLANLQATPASFADADFHPSFSYGLARFPEDGDDLGSLTAAADRRLYAMKSTAPGHRAANSEGPAAGNKP